MKSIDLFAGAGGLSLGLSRVGIECVLANEIMPDAAKTFQLNNPNAVVITEDIREINFSEELCKLNLKKGDIDLLCGGPPCQGYSTIGNKKESDPRNSLFREFLRAVKEVEPKYVLFENVAGFKNLYGGKAFQELTEELENMDYSYFWGPVQVADYGVPQLRTRTIILASKKGNKKVLLPKGDDKRLSIMDAIGDLPKLISNDWKDRYDTMPYTPYQLTIRDGETVLRDHNSSNYGENMRKILSSIPEGGNKMDIPEDIRPKKGFANAYARLRANDPSTTITRNFGTPSSSRCVHPTQNRALSTREGARLQSFPDTYQFVGGKGSKNLQIGNAVPPLVGEAIGKQFFL
jgi:DNA (cytosine-5)-methyltransferase 1